MTKKFEDTLEKLKQIAAENRRLRQREDEWIKLTQVALRPWSRIDDSMISGPNAFLGDTRRALAQRPEFVKKTCRKYCTTCCKVK